MTVGTLVGWKSGAVMFPMSGMSGAGLGQQGSGQDPGNVNPMSPTRAEAGCAGVPVPPSTPSTGSRQQQANGQQFVSPGFCQGWNQGCCGNAGGCVGQQGQGFVPGFMGNMSGAVSGSASGGLNPSLPVGSSMDPSRVAMFGPYGRLSPDLSGPCLNPSAVSGEGLSGFGPRSLGWAVWIKIKPPRWLP